MSDLTRERLEEIVAGVLCEDTHPTSADRLSLNSEIQSIADTLYAEIARLRERVSAVERERDQARDQAEDYRVTINHVLRKVQPPGSPCPGGLTVGVLHYVGEMVVNHERAEAEVARLREALETAKAWCPECDEEDCPACEQIDAALSGGEEE